MDSPTVAVIGGGLAGLAAAIALADQGFRVSVFEKRPRLGGRATSYVLPDGRCIDNCQHVTLGCCTNLDDFYRRIGAREKIRYYDSFTFVDAKGRRGTVKRSPLPAPLHLAPSFITLPLLEWTDKLAIARGMRAIVSGRGAPPDSAGISMLEWLQRHKQTPRAIEVFWRSVLVSALNEELERTDAAHGVAVFWKAFLMHPRGFEMGIPSVPLSELYENSGRQIERHGGTVRTRCGVSELRFDRLEAASMRLDDGSVATADFYIAAVPFDRLLKLLPEGVQRQDEFAKTSNLKLSPITSVHLWLDRPVMTEPFLTLVDYTTQWIFNKSLLHPHETEPAGQYLQCVISASYNLSSRSQQEIIDLCRSEMLRVLPSMTQANLIHSVVVRESAASFSPSPDSDRWRPLQRTSFRNLFLAGDWTQTGWPATMESAVRSGYLAAEELLRAAGQPQKLLKAELPAQPLARWLGKKS
jgi:squalene-associated FAD-dependent desaturase